MPDSFNDFCNLSPHLTSLKFLATPLGGDIVLCIQLTGVTPNCREKLYRRMILIDKMLEGISDVIYPSCFYPNYFHRNLFGMIAMTLSYAKCENRPLIIAS